VEKVNNSKNLQKMKYIDLKYTNGFPEDSCLLLLNPAAIGKKRLLSNQQTLFYSFIPAGKISVIPGCNK
jgi:hypothetical protein